MGVLSICDELAAGLEPDETLRDDARSAPTTYEAGILYVWPRVVQYQPEGDGSIDLANFDIRAARVYDRQGEGEPDRSVTDEIVADAEAVASWIRAHRDGTAYEGIQVSIDVASLIGIDWRGWQASFIGYVLEVD